MSTAARAELAARLAARREEIARAVWARVQTIADPAEVSDRHYLEGLRAAVGAAIEYAIALVEAGDDRAPAIPASLISQARHAVHAGVSLDTVLRRYFSGFAVFSDFVLQEIESSPTLRDTTLQEMLRSHSTLFDNLIAVVGKEFSREFEQVPDSPGQRRAGRVKGLLAGEYVDGSELAYDLDAHHVGLVAIGPHAQGALRDLARALDCASLIVPVAEETVWAWFGSRRRLDPGEVVDRAIQRRPVGMTLTVGEPGARLEGWRLTHRQAQAAVPIALRGPSFLVRYSEVALLCAMLGDELLAASLKQLYLAPLSADRDGGAALRETLRAYFAARGNVSSAAAALGVTRHTVANRLDAIEERIGRPFGDCTTELEVALQLEDFGSGTVVGGGFRIGRAAAAESREGETAMRSRR